MIWTVAIILFLCCGTLFFSASAMSLHTLSRAKLLEAFKATGKQNLADHLADNLGDRAESLALACTLFRIAFNMAVLLCLVAAFSRSGNDILTVGQYIWAFTAAAVLLSIFSLAIPHAWAKYAGEGILARTMPLLNMAAIIAWPFLFLYELYEIFVRRLLGVAWQPEDKEERQEEFLTDLQQHRLEGIVDAEEQEMIENVLELADTSASEIMTPRTDIVAVKVSSDLPEVIKTVRKAGHSRLPVYEESVDNIVGMIYAKDLLAEIGGDDLGFSLGDKMRPVYFVPETKPLRDLLHEFQNQKLHIAVVLDEYGGTAGIVTIEDILEELVGEIADEYETPPPRPIKRIDDDTIEVDARTHVDDLNDQFELSLPEDDDYETIGGFVFSYLGYVPKAGESFEYGTLKLLICSAEPRRVKRLRIEGISQPDRDHQAGKNNR